MLRRTVVRQPVGPVIGIEEPPGPHLGWKFDRAEVDLAGEDAAARAPG
jgi:hypothetical protein